MTLHSDRQQLYELTEDEVNDQFHGTTRDQAWHYYSEEYVFETEIDGAALFGVVDDDIESYVAEISVQDGSIYLGCTCDHTGPGICAHIGAVLLSWVHQRETFEGYNASVNGATQIRAGVLRPEIIVPHDMVEDDSAEALSQGMVPGTPIRIIRQPYFGDIGKVHSLPVELQRLESESKVRVVNIELDNGEVVTVPRANVEIIEE